MGIHYVEHEGKLYWYCTNCSVEVEKGWEWV